MKKFIYWILLILRFSLVFGFEWRRHKILLQLVELWHGEIIWIWTFLTLLKKKKVKVNGEMETLESFMEKQ